MTSDRSSASTRVDTFFSHSPLTTWDGLPSEVKRAWPQWENDVFHSVVDKASLPFEGPIVDLFLHVRNLNRALFEAVEGRAFVSEKAWKKNDGMGGGVISVGRGDILEKAAVNISMVGGPSYPAVEHEHAGKPFTAGGVSLICHPKNPKAPIVHMNIRMLCVGEPGSQKIWIGGGADLTPMFRYEEDTELFHSTFKAVCDRNRLGDYPKFKAWCDEYFFIKHRNEARGIGGIFFDYLPIEDLSDTSLLLDVGQHLVHAYGIILGRRVDLPYSEDEKEKHLYWRGRYAEFNLAYDRGTRFGFLSGGNTEAILCSMPPVVKW